MKRRALYFTGPRRMEMREETFPSPDEGEVLVRTLVSAVSAGTEMLVYRGQLPADIAVDATIPGLALPFAYPLKYGYANVGVVTAVGAKVDAAWKGKRVFSLHPHEDWFSCVPDDLISIPDDITSEDAVFLPFMDTAVTLVMDGRPLIGELVAVFGQGIIGLLTTALLARFPLGKLLAVDRYALRRQKAREMGAGACFDPSPPGRAKMLDGIISSAYGTDGADLVFELSGDPAALNDVLAVTGHGGRVVIGSWYGSKTAEVRFGERFHRGRQRIISSQVSTVAPEHSGRWTKLRRSAVALSLLRTVKPAALITHRREFADAAELYDTIDRQPHEMLQAVLDYGFPGEGSCIP